MLGSQQAMLLLRKLHNGDPDVLRSRIKGKCIKNYLLVQQADYKHCNWKKIYTSPLARCTEILGKVILLCDWVFHHLHKHSFFPQKLLCAFKCHEDEKSHAFQYFIGKYYSKSLQGGRMNSKTDCEAGKTVESSTGY